MNSNNNVNHSKQRSAFRPVNPTRFSMLTQMLNKNLIMMNQDQATHSVANKSSEPITPDFNNNFVYNFHEETRTKTTLTPLSSKTAQERDPHSFGSQMDLLFNPRPKQCFQEDQSIVPAVRPAEIQPRKSLIVRIDLSDKENVSVDAKDKVSIKQCSEEKVQQLPKKREQKMLEKEGRQLKKPGPKTIALDDYKKQSVLRITELENQLQEARQIKPNDPKQIKKLRDKICALKQRVEMRNQIELNKKIAMDLAQALQSNLSLVQGGNEIISNITSDLKRLWSSQDDDNLENSSKSQKLNDFDLETLIEDQFKAK